MNLWSYKYRECFLLQADGEPEGRPRRTRVLVTLCLLIPVPCSVTRENSSNWILTVSAFS